MAAFIATDIKDMITIKVKPRHDSFTDQYNRLFMPKMLLISTLIMSVAWFTDSIKCIVPETHAIEPEFVSAACWIQGVYIYKELINKVDAVAYYGMPKNMDNDGMLKGTDELCSTQPKLGSPPPANCFPMTKTFFLQYQYMPFLVASIAIVYYVPYYAYMFAEKDRINLRKAIKDEKVDAKKITNFYFNHRISRPRTLRLRVFVGIFVKILYVLANLTALLGVDTLVDHQYVAYGVRWTRWSFLDNHIAYDYMGLRDFPKPGNRLLPPFGYCELYESARDVKVTIANKHKFVCELSQNILYQYALLVLWFCFIIGIILSGIGLVMLLANYLVGMLCARPYTEDGEKIYKALTLREIDYLEFMKDKNHKLYQEVITQIKENIIGPGSHALENGPLLSNS